MWRIDIVLTNDINGLHCWNYRIGLTKFTNKKIENCTKFAIKIHREGTSKIYTCDG